MCNSERRLWAAPPPALAFSAPSMMRPGLKLIHDDCPPVRYVKQLGGWVRFGGQSANCLHCSCCSLRRLGSIGPVQGSDYFTTQSATLLLPRAHCAALFLLSPPAVTGLQYMVQAALVSH